MEDDNEIHKDITRGSSLQDYTADPDINNNNYYQILGVTNNATIKEIADAYNTMNVLYSQQKDEILTIIMYTLTRLRQLYDNGLKIGVPLQKLHFFFTTHINMVRQNSDDYNYSQITIYSLLKYCVQQDIIKNKRDNLTNDVYNLTYYEILGIPPNATPRQISTAVDAAPQSISLYIREIIDILEINNIYKQVYDYGLSHNVNPLKLRTYCAEKLRLRHPISIPNLRQYCIDNNIHIDPENSIPKPTPPIVAENPDLPLDTTPFPEIHTPPQTQAQRQNLFPKPTPRQTSFSDPNNPPHIDSVPNPMLQQQQQQPPNNPMPMSPLLFHRNNNNLRNSIQPQLPQPPRTRGTQLHNTVAAINENREQTHPMSLTNDEQMSALGIAGVALAAAAIAVPVAMAFGGKKKNNKNKNNNKKKKSVKNNKNKTNDKLRLRLRLRPRLKTRKRKRRCYTCKKYKSR